MSEQPKKSVYELLLDRLERACDNFALFQTLRLGRSDFFGDGPVLIFIIEIMEQMDIPEENCEEIIDHLHRISEKLKPSDDETASRLRLRISRLADCISARQQDRKQSAAREEETIARIERS